MLCELVLYVDHIVRVFPAETVNSSRRSWNARVRDDVLRQQAALYVTLHLRLEKMIALGVPAPKEEPHRTDLQLTVLRSAQTERLHVAAECA